MAPASTLSYAVPILIVVPLLYRRFRKMLKPQELKLGRLWVRPAVYVVIAAGAMLAPTPGASALAPSMLGCAKSPLALSGFTEPP